MSRTRLAVVFGGRSTEHSISCVSAGSILAAVDRDRYDVVAVAITPDGRWVLAADDPARLARSGRLLPSVTDGRGVALPGDPTIGGLVALDDGLRRRAHEAADAMAADGVRVLGVAMRRWPTAAAVPQDASLEDELTFLGLGGMVDPARPEVAEAVATCRAAGMRAVMITGDHPLTATAIGRQLGLADDASRAVTGAELDALDDEALDRTVRATAIYARVSPEHKLRIVGALQRQGQVVAMTGDGVNDAPALKQADIGVAMGITGTDVTKDAADMVLLDDDFATIIGAVREGRVVFDNIRKYVRNILSGNVAEVSVMVLGPLFGMPIPLLPLQILWLNLVTDGLPAMALAVEPPEERVMSRPPTPLAQLRQHAERHPAQQHVDADEQPAGRTPDRVAQHDAGQRPAPDQAEDDPAGRPLQQQQGERRVRPGDEDEDHRVVEALHHLTRPAGPRPAVVGR